MPDETAEIPSPPAPPPPGEAPPPPAEDWSTRYKYLLADFENYRRRTERERESISRAARGALIRELLPILEAFRSAQQAVQRLPADDPVRHGLELLDRAWMTFLKHEGVTPVAEVGQPFRSEEAEAVGEAPPRPGIPEGGVAEVVQQGYRFYGGVLRPAKVVVARAPPSPPETAAAEPSAEEP
ncbi:MAG: nucleotide exchange factor GrpE [Thermoplasmata archaeon]